MTTDEQHTQRMNALAAGNEVRRYRADVKRDVAQGIMRPELVFAARDAKLDGMVVEEYLRAVPGLGPAKVLRARRHCGFNAETVFSHLNDRQRAWLIMWLHDHVAQSARYEQVVARCEQAVA
jgi:hypothetical protein